VRKRLEALADSPDLLELSKDFPIGAFQHVNGAMLRQIVLVLQDRLFDLKIPLRLAIEPKSDRKTKSGELRLPLRLSVFDGDLRFSIPIATYETSVEIGDTLVMTARDDAVERVARALVEAIENVLWPSESE
jgi:hypothetical protein